jgi:hypothetical protein
VFDLPGDFPFFDNVEAGNIINVEGTLAPEVYSDDSVLDALNVEPSFIVTLFSVGVLVLVLNRKNISIILMSIKLLFQNIYIQIR